MELSLCRAPPHSGPHIPRDSFHLQVGNLEVQPCEVIEEMRFNSRSNNKIHALTNIFLQLWVSVLFIEKNGNNRKLKRRKLIRYCPQNNPVCRFFFPCPSSSPQFGCSLSFSCFLFAFTTIIFTFFFLRPSPGFCKHNLEWMWDSPASGYVRVT